MSKMPKFNGRALVETPDIPMIGYLEGEFGEVFLEKYNSIVDEKYNGNKTLKVLKFENNVVKGSSTYSSAISADILRQNGLEIAKPADIEFARELYKKTNGASGFNTRDHCYVDYGIVFRSVDNPNEYLAQQLEPQIKKALGVKKIKNPVPIFSEDLELLNDENGPHGLGFSLRKQANLFEVPVLKKDVNFSETDENGMPISDKNGSRTSYTINSGLSGLDLDGDLGLASGWGDLDGSNSAGRVVAKKK